MRLVNQLLPRIAFLAALAAAAADPLHAGSWCGNPVPPCDPTNPSSKCYQPPPPDPRCEPRECKKCTKSPCYVGSGVYVNSAVDLELPTPGFTISAARNYESTHTIDGPMGHGWNSSLTAHLYFATYFLAAPNFSYREANITMPDGARYRFVEDGSGGFTPPLGRHDTLVRNPDGSFDLTLQRTMSKFHFTAEGALETMTDDYGNALRFRYDGSGQLQRVEDLAGSERYIDVYWGADGRLSNLVDVAGRQISFEYDAAGLLIAATDPAGRTTHYAYTPGKYVPLLSSISDHWGRAVTSITFDSKDRVTGYSDEGETYTYSYGYGGNPSKTAKSDSGGNTWVFTYSTAGLVSQEVAPSGSGGGTRSATYSVDGLVVESIDAANIRTCFSYDRTGRVSSTTYDCLGSSAIRFDFEYDPNFPDRLSSVTPRNPVTNLIDSAWQGWRYDYYQTGSIAPGALNHVYRVRSDGTTLDLIRTNEFDSRGRITAILDAEGARTDLVYDVVGDLVEVVAPSNNIAGDRPRTHYSYDVVGDEISSQDPLGGVTSYSRDALGRVTTVTVPSPGSELDPLPLYFTSTMSHDLFDVSSQLLFVDATDPNGLLTRRGYDAFGRLVRVEDQTGEVTSYSYSNGLLSSVQDPHGYSTSYVYDSLRRLLHKTFPDGQQEHFSYWPDGGLRTKTDRRGQVTSYTFDALKRLKTRMNSSGEGLTLGYLGQSLVSVLDSSATPDELHAFTFDSSYRMASETQATRGTVSYSYTPSDRVAGYTISGGAGTSYLYFPDGAVKSIAWTDMPGLFEYTYNLRGQETQVLFPNGQQRLFEYDNQGRLTQVSNQHPSIGTLAEFSYSYDGDSSTGLASRLGQRVAVTTSFPAFGVSSKETKYSYDDAYQLTRVEYPSGDIDEWTYDAIGNRTSESINGDPQTLSYLQFGSNPLSSSRLASDGEHSYQYDAAGNVTLQAGPSGSLNFSWNAENELAAISGAYSESYKYDYAGRRTKTSGPLGEVTALFVGPNAVATSSTTSSSVLFGPGVDQLLATETNGTVEFAVVDGLGTVVAKVDSAGGVTQAADYDPWGNVRSFSGSGAPEVGFTGREFSGAGLWYFRTRWYDPEVGRFLQEDRLSDLIPISGRDLYQYVNNAPTRFVDPFGLIPCTITHAFGPKSFGRTHQRRMGPWKFVSKVTCLPGDCLGSSRWDSPVGGYERCNWSAMFAFARKWRMEACFTITCVCPESETTDCEIWRGVDTWEEELKTFTLSTFAWIWKECPDPNVVKRQ